MGNADLPSGSVVGPQIVFSAATAVAPGMSNSSSAHTAKTRRRWSSVMVLTYPMI